MFDKLIVSDEQGAEFRGRSRYFVVSTAVVGVLFVTALVFSLYAADIGLGNADFELSTMLAPVTPSDPEPPREDPLPKRRDEPQTDLPIRNQNILRIDEPPMAIPDKVSVEPGQFRERPIGRFVVSDGIETNGSGVPGGTELGRGNGNSPGTSSGSSVEPEAVAERIPEPPPAIAPKPAAPRSLGVVNGKATNLPKPTYTAAAIAVNAQGEVSVQVTIDETGRVISAKAVSGHPLLKRESERAAMNATFSPTTLSKVPVKVTGVIIYNFKRS